MAGIGTDDCTKDDTKEKKNKKEYRVSDRKFR